MWNKEKKKERGRKRRGRVLGKEEERWEGNLERKRKEEKTECRN